MWDGYLVAHTLQAFSMSWLVQKPPQAPWSKAKLKAGLFILLQPMSKIPPSLKQPTMQMMLTPILRHEGGQIGVTGLKQV